MPLHYNVNMITLKQYSEKVGVPIESLLGKSRKYPVAAARETYWLHLRQNGLTHSKIAEMFNRDRTTVISGIDRAKNLILTNDKWALSCFGKSGGDVRPTFLIPHPFINNKL
jgi:chromosomal replication initiation ATPase DnaA